MSTRRHDLLGTGIKATECDKIIYLKGNLIRCLDVAAVRRSF